MTPEEEKQALGEVEALLTTAFPTESKEFQDTLRVVIGGLFFGTNADRLARVFGLNRDKFVRPRVKRLRDNGIWIRDKILLNFNAGDFPQVEFTLMALVAEGALMTTPSKVAQGEPGYVVDPGLKAVMEGIG